MKLINIFFLCIFSFSVSVLTAQTKGMPCDNVPGKNALQLKWFNNDFVNSLSFNLYRQEEGSTQWVKVNTEPIISATAIPNSEDGQYYQQHLKVLASKDEASIAFDKSFLFMRLIRSNGLAKLMNMYYIDNSVELGKTYSYVLKKIDGNKEIEYAISPPVKVETYKKQSAPTACEALAGEHSVKLKWKNDSLAMLYQIYRSNTADFKSYKISGVIMNTALMPQQENNNDYLFVDDDSTITIGKTYYYKVVALDIFGNESEMSALISATTSDQTPPQAVTLLKAAFVKNHVHLSWKKSPSKDCKGYVLYRSFYYDKNYAAVNSIMLNAKDTSFDDSFAAEGKVLNYYVQAIDNNNNKSQSFKVSVAVPDVTAPSVPIALSAAAAAASSGKIKLTWNNNSESDLMGYYVFRGLKNKAGNFNLLNAKPLRENFFEDQLEKEASNAFVYKICAVDSAWNRSKETEIISVKMPDVMPPSPPVLRKAELKRNAVVLVWSAGFNKDIKGFEVLRKTNLLHGEKNSYEKISNSLLAKDTSFMDERIENGTNYSYVIIAKDSADNVSPQSNALSVFVNTSAAVKVPNNIIATYDAAKNEVKLSWTDIAQPSNFKGYMVFRKEEGENYIPISDSFLQNEFTDNTVEKGVRYFYLVHAIDRSGNMVQSKDEKVVSTVK